MKKWAGKFNLGTPVRIIVSGETGVVVAVWISSQYTVRYCRADGVAVEAVWSEDALAPVDGAEVVALRVVETKAA